MRYHDIQKTVESDLFTDCGCTNCGNGRVFVARVVAEVELEEERAAAEVRDEIRRRNTDSRLEDV